MEKKDIKKLAQQFMLNAVKAQAGDKVWVEYMGEVGKELAEACADTLAEVGASAHIVDSSAITINAKLATADHAAIQKMGEEGMATMQQMQGYIRIKDDDDQERITVPVEKMNAYKTALSGMTNYRVNNTRWLVTAAPTADFAKACGMGLSEFEKFYLDVCLLDYKTMSEAVKPLVKLMTEGKDVHILSPAQETDLRFSIAGIPALPCTGDVNIPDGECFTAPVKDSINGTIKFGPSAYDGQRFKFIKLEIKDGKIIDARAENDERTATLNKMLDADEGARYFGEFAINFNPFIQHPTGSILFDEKIDGGLHLAAGNCYDDAPNGNKSSVHWDMVHIQRPDYGGGEIYIDGRLIRKDGIFVLPELQALNPAELKKAAAAAQAKMKP